MRVVITERGEGFDVVVKALSRLDGRGRQAMSRGLIDGGRKMRTQVRLAVREQTGLKRPYVSRTITGHLHADGMAYVIAGTGRGPKITELRSVTGRKRRQRVQRRNARGQFKALRPDLAFERGLVRATIWGKRRRFARSYVDDRGRFRVLRDKVETMNAPSPSKELVKDQSLATFLASTGMINESVAKALTRLARPAFSRR